MKTGNYDTAMTALEAAIPYLRRTMSEAALRADMEMFSSDILALAESEEERENARSRLALIVERLSGDPA